MLYIEYKNKKGEITMSRSNISEGFFKKIELEYSIDAGDNTRKIGKELISLIKEGIELAPEQKRILTIHTKNSSSEIVELFNTLIPKYILPYVSKIKLPKETLTNKNQSNDIPNNHENNFR